MTCVSINPRTRAAIGKRTAERIGWDHVIRKCAIGKRVFTLRPGARASASAHAKKRSQGLWLKRNYKCARNASTGQFKSCHMAPGQRGG